MEGILYIGLMLILTVGIPPGERMVQQEPACLDCHSDLIGGASVHMALDAGCDACHESTGEAHPRDGISGFSLVDQVPDLCYYCHSELSGLARTHAPVKDGQCLSCHDVHSAAESRLLINKAPGVCISCHNRDYETDSTFTANIERVLAIGKSVHSALVDGDCMLCHLPHESEFHALLAEAYPQTPYVEASPDSFAICFMCHDAGLLTEEQTEWATGFRNGHRNLHFLHINGSKGRNCNLCHDAHAARGQYLVKDRVRFGNWEMDMNYIPQEQGGSCLPGCHGPLTYTRELSSETGTEQ